MNRKYFASHFRDSNYDLSPLVAINILQEYN